MAEHPMVEEVKKLRMGTTCEAVPGEGLSIPRSDVAPELRTGVTNMRQPVSTWSLGGTYGSALVLAWGLCCLAVLVWVSIGACTCSHAERPLAGLATAGLAGAGGLMLWWRRGMALALAAARALAERTAAGDLREVPDRLAASEPDGIGATLQQLRTQLGKRLARIDDAAQRIAPAAARMAQGNGYLADRARERAAVLEQTAAAMETLTTSVQRNADSACTAYRLVDEGTAIGRRSEAATQALAQQMDAIDAASQRVCEIIGVIESIAFQTNILALNAAVEAARAGRQGQGFAVVAAEVRALAVRSANAAREIGGLIAVATAQVKQGRVRATEAGEAMQGMVRNANEVGGLIAVIAQASQSQGEGIAEVREAIAGLDQAAQRNAATVQDVTAAAHLLEEQSRLLAAVLGDWRWEAVPAATALQSLPIKPLEPLARS